MIQAFLVYEAVSTGDRFSLALEPDLAAAVPNWHRSTRVSPVWIPSPSGLAARRKSKSRKKLAKESGDRIRSASAKLKASTTHVVVLGPLGSRQIAEDLSNWGDCWLTLGVLNVVLVANDAASAKKAFDWARDRRGVCCEWWVGKKGRYAVKKRTADGVAPTDIVTSLQALAGVNPGELLRDVHSEFVTLSISAASRAAVCWPGLLNDIRRWIKLVSDELAELASAEPRRTAFQVLALMTSMNAGLSRLTSQAFSGIPPVAQTETHWWVHSLFGTAIGNIALWNLTRRLESGLQSLRLTSRLAAASLVPWNGEHLINLEPHHEQLETSPLTDDLVNRALLRTIDRTSEAPPIPFFSGRDGFHASEIGISAPLAALTGGTSSRWTLKTLTHELCHPVVQSVLDHLLDPVLEGSSDASATEPSIQKGPSSFSDFVRLVNSTHDNASMAARGALLSGLLFMASNGETATKEELTPAKLRKICEERLPEVEELLVSVMDYLYFYGKPKRYFSEVWLTWTAVPVVYDRKEEYLVRTLVAVLPYYIRLGGDPISVAIDDLEKELGRIAGKTTLGADMLRDAARHLRGKEKDKVVQQVAARMPIARLAMHFLHDEKLGAALMRDSAAGRQPYSGRPRNAWGLSVETFDNALRVVEESTTSVDANSESGLAMMYTLAFQIAGEPSYA